MRSRTPGRAVAGFAVALGFLAGAGPARAENACVGAIDRLGAEWDAIGMTSASKPAARVSGRGGHAHVQAEVDMMRNHYRRAIALCREGKDHEALLHVDLVRAWLKLPVNPHPASHQERPR